MTRYYVSHYFDFKNIGIFLLVSLIGLIAVLAIVLITAKLQVHRRLNYEGLDECNVAEITRRHRFREIGMIESFYEPDDKRVKHVKLTDKGRGVCKHAWANMVKKEEWFLSSLDDDEKEELWRLLQKIYDNMRRNEV